MKPIFRRSIAVFIAMVMTASAMSAGAKAVDETQESATGQTSSTQKDESVEMLDVSSVEEAENPDPQTPSQEEGQAPKKPYVHNAEGLAEFKRLTQERLDIISELSAVRDTKQELENAENSEQVQKQVVRAMQAKQPDLDTADFESKEAVSNELDVQERKLLDDLKAKENQLEGIGAVPSDEILEQLPAGPTETNENGMLRTAPTQSLKDLEERLGAYYVVYGCESLVSGNEGTYKCYTISAQDHSDNNFPEEKYPRVLHTVVENAEVYNGYVTTNEYDKIMNTTVRFIFEEGLTVIVNAAEAATKIKIPATGWAISNLVDYIVPEIAAETHAGNNRYRMDVDTNTACYYAYVKTKNGYDLLAETNYSVIDTEHRLTREGPDPNTGINAVGRTTIDERFYMTGMVRELEFEAVEQYEWYNHLNNIPIRHLSTSSLTIAPIEMKKGFHSVHTDIKYARTMYDLIVLAEKGQVSKPEEK